MKPKHKPKRTAIAEIGFHSKQRQATDAAELAAMAEIRVRPPPTGDKCGGDRLET
ncbi:MAG TPA: hypothetical protein VN456_03460 [Desulfosporosinus sp.]|nr:hypothetical protein [Desulfosporosinus sp.]